MDATITPSDISGTTRAPPSKSYTHRAILAAGYTNKTTVHNPLWSADTQASAKTVELFGGKVSRSEEKNCLVIHGFNGRPNVPADVIDCGNSGTLMRLVTPMAALADGMTVLTGDESLRSRPQEALLEAVEALDSCAKSTRSNGQAPLVIQGPLSGGNVSIPGDVSSQYVSALLMAGAITTEGITIDLETELKSSPYVDITIELLEDFNVNARRDDGFVVNGGQAYESDDSEYRIPSDFSSISYLVAAGAIGSDGSVKIEDAYPSAQGDSAIIDILDRMGAKIDWKKDSGELFVSKSSLDEIEVSVEDIPDLLPTIAVLGAVADGDTQIINAAHVRFKETDRISSMAEELGKMGVKTTEKQDSLTIHGGESTLVGTTVNGRGDHRVIMSLAIAGLVADGETVIEGAEHVDVSFPNFFEKITHLGANVRTNK